MSDNFSGLIGNIPDTPPNQNSGVPDNLFLVSSIIIIIIGAAIIVAAVVMLFKRGVFRRFYHRVKKTLKSESVTFLLQNNSCSHTVGEFVEKDLQNATSVIIIWQNGDDDIYAVTDDNLDDSKAVGMMLQMANKVSSENGN